jgi:hypothetical protein
VIFQTLDNKKTCVGIYYNDKLNFNSELPEDISSTWSYSAFLKNKNIDYANIFCEGKSLDEVCPDHLKNDWNKINNMLKCHINACKESKINFKENCFFDLIPAKFFINYCDIKNKITKYVFQNYEKPVEYEFYKKFIELTTDIKYRKLNINIENMHSKLYKESANSFFKKISQNQGHIDYNIFGSITGRLTVKKDSFPILTFPKQFRNILIPTNDWFISFDMNAAEIRTALALAGVEQPSGDFHQWTVENIYNNELTRAEAKETTTSWLYNSNSYNAIKYDFILSKIFDKNKLKSKYWIDNKVYTPYNRIIESDEYHAISYLNQSTFIDLFHRQTIKIDEYLQNKKSFVAFMIHDELVLDLTEDEKNQIIDIIKILQSTPYGIFPVNVKAGKNFGEMKKLNLKVE